jgi:hypothetical protein
MFVLTKQEQRTVAFVVLILILGLATKHYRATHPPNEHAPPAASPTRSDQSG